MRGRAARAGTGRRPSLGRLCRRSRHCRRRGWGTRAADPRRRRRRADSAADRTCRRAHRRRRRSRRTACQAAAHRRAGGAVARPPGAGPPRHGDDRALHRPARRQAPDRSSTGREVRLTEKEAAILAYLYRAGGRVTGREILLGEVWGYRAGVTTHTLETHIYRLRRKIERDPGRAEILVTAPGGYRLVP